MQVCAPRQNKWQQIKRLVMLWHPSRYNCDRGESCIIHRFVEWLLPFVFVCCFPDVQLLFPMQTPKEKKLSQKVHRRRILWI